MILFVTDVETINGGRGPLRRPVFDRTGVDSYQAIEVRPGKFVVACPDLTVAPSGTVDVTDRVTQKLNTPQSNVLGNRLGIDPASIRGLTLGEVVALYLDGTFVPTGDNRIRFGLSGVTLYDAPAIQGGATDSFTYSNGRLSTVSSSVWDDNTSNMAVSSNAVVFSASNASGYAFHQTAVTANDHYAQVDTTPGNGEYAGGGVLIRGNGNASSVDGYRVEFGTWTNPLDHWCAIARIDGGSSTEVSTVRIGAEGTSSHLLLAEVTGNTIEVFVDGVSEDTYTSATSYTTQKYTGIYAGRYGGNSVTIDNFESGNLGGTAATATPSVVAATTTIPAPTVTAASSVSVSPATVAVTCSVPSPSVSTATDATATPSAVAATTSVPAPTVTAAANASITPSTVAAISAVQTVTVTASSGITTTPATIVAVGSVDSPTITAEANALATANVVAGLVAIPPPSVSTSSATPWFEDFSDAAVGTNDWLPRTDYSSPTADSTWQSYNDGAGYDVIYCTTNSHVVRNTGETQLIVRARYKVSGAGDSVGGLIIKAVSDIKYVGMELVITSEPENKVTFFTRDDATYDEFAEFGQVGGVGTSFGLVAETWYDIELIYEDGGFVSGRIDGELILDRYELDSTFNTAIAATTNGGAINYTNTNNFDTLGAEGYVVATPATVAASVAVPAPSVSTVANATATPATVAATATILAPTVTATATATATPSTVTTVASVATPDVSAGGSATVAAATVTATVSVPAPTVTAGQSVTVTLGAPVAATSTVDTPTVTAVGNASVAAGVVASTTTVDSPTVTATGNASVTLGAPVATTSSVPAPTVSIGATATPSTVAATTSVPVPNVSAGGSVTANPDPVAVTSSVPAPTVTAVANASATVGAPVAATSTVDTPTVTTEGALTNIYYGSTTVDTLYVGASTVDAVYYGATRVT